MLISPAGLSCLGQRLLSEITQTAGGSLFFGEELERLDHQTDPVAVNGYDGWVFAGLRLAHGDGAI